MRLDNCQCAFIYIAEEQGGSDMEKGAPRRGGGIASPQDADYNTLYRKPCCKTTSAAPGLRGVRFMCRTGER